MFTIFVYNHNTDSWESYKSTVRGDEAKSIITRLTAAGVDCKIISIMW